MSFIFLFESFGAEVDPAAGVLGTTATPGTFTVAKSLPVPAASPATISH